MKRARSWRHRGVALATLLILVLSACGSAEPRSPTPTPLPPGGTPSGGSLSGPCSSGRLTVGDLAGVDAVVDQGVEEAVERAREWQDDARLIALRAGCALLDSAYHFRLTFFSERIQTYYFSDTGETEVAPPSNLAGVVLPVDQVSFRNLANSLQRAGFATDTWLDTGSNVEARVNTEGAPFGPSNVPDNVVVFHVALESRGEVVDLFVDADDGTVYQYPR